MMIEKWIQIFFFVIIIFYRVLIKEFWERIEENNRKKIKY